jgi:3-phosphoshikimate 1-carboxyvinyltransferase
MTGDGSLSRRPMDRVATPLAAMGASVSTRAGCPPIHIEGGRHLRGLTHESPVASAQVKSALLLAGLSAQGETRVVERPRSRDHTERMLRAMGVDVHEDGPAVVLRPGRTPLAPLDLTVAGDPSAAAFYAAAAAILPGSSILLRAVTTNPTRFGFFAVLERMGTDVEVLDLRDEGGEPVADLRITAAPLRGIEVTPEEIPALVDEVPILAVVAAMASGPSRITGAAELRVKETDRLSAVARSLTVLGAGIEELEDGLVLAGGGLRSGGRVEAEGDHRMAMSLQVAALVAPSPVHVDGGAVAAVSDPHFLATLEALRS